MPTIEQARAWYPEKDPIHGFDHILRVYRMADRIGTAEGADMEIVHAAALLHDVEGSMPGGESRVSHHEFSALYAGRVLEAEGWSAERIAAVQHCIRAHRYRSGGERPATLEAKVIYDADKLDVLGAIGAARTIGYAVLAGEPIYAQPSEQFLRSGEKEPGEPHSAYHEHIFKLSKVKDSLHTATAHALAQERHQYLEEFFIQLGAETQGTR